MKPIPCPRVLWDRVGGDALMNAMRVTEPAILVVEDEALVRELASATLSELGYPVLEAGSAKEALEILAGVDSLRGMLTDIQMPGLLDGLDLAKLVREQFPDAGILVTSGRAMPGKNEIPNRARYISKPWDSDDLIGAMRNLLPKS